jgi:DNA topoisomerase-3
MKLYICEKPSQGRDLARNLGVSGQGNGFIGNNNIAVTWAIGHLIQQLNPDEVDPKYSAWKMEHLPIVPKVWKMKPNPKTLKQLNAIKGLLKKAKHVIIATDGDREGEVIGRELLDYFNWSGRIDRLWLTALNDASIQKALKNLKPGAETQSLYNAGIARARADWIVGMSASRAISIMAGKQGFRGKLSVGRVQTPTLAIVAKREVEIKKFKPQDYYDLIGVFSGVSAKWQSKSSNEEGFDSQGRCIDYAIAQKTVHEVESSGSAVVEQFATTRKKMNPPLLHSIDTLQALASKSFGFSVKQTLDLAQALYEKHKATTYPRSDCQYLPTSQLTEVKQVMRAVQGVDNDLGKLISNADLSLKSKVWNDKKLNAHHAIIPTANNSVDVSNMTTDECKLYELICRSYIAQFYPNYEYDQTVLEINASNHLFSASVNVDVKLGWKVVINSQATLKQNVVPKLSEGQALNIDTVDIETKQTKPPSRYNEGSLLVAMKNAHQFVIDPNLKKILKGDEGIGTAATRANIIDLLKKRNFIQISKKQIILSETGKALIDAVPSEIKDPGMTAIMEGSLSKIASGELTLQAFIDWQEKWIFGLIETIKSQVININPSLKTKSIECPDCGENMFLRKGKKGQFWGCSGYPTCKTVAQDNNGKAVFERDMPDCPECGKKLRRINGKKGWFWSCKGYFDNPQCKFITQDEAGKPVFKD